MKYQDLGVLQYEVRADVLPDCWSSWKRTVLSSSTGSTSTRTTAVATGRRKVRKQQWEENCNAKWKRTTATDRPYQPHPASHRHIAIYIIHVRYSSYMYVAS